MYIDAIRNGSQLPDTAYADVHLDTGDKIMFKIDTGAQANVIPKNIYDWMKNPPLLRKCQHCLTSYTGQQLKNMGCIQATAKYKENL